MQNERKFEDIFDDSLKNAMSLEKIIYESVAMYKENPNEQMKYLITNLCINTRNQLNVLMDILSQISNGEILKNYQEKLMDKMDELFDIQKEISENRQK